MVLSGAGSYTGGTIVAEGTLVLANSSAIAAGTNLTIGADASLAFAAAPVSDSANDSLVKPYTKDAAIRALDAVFAQYGR